MGKSGPMRTPTALLAARGSWLSKKRTEEPVVSEPMIEKPPAWLTNADALECWKRLRPVLGWMRAADSNVFTRYCEAWGRYHERLRAIAIVTEPDDVRDLDVQIAKLNEQMIRMEQHIGLTPAARTNIKADAKPKDEKKIRIIEGAKKKTSR